MTRLILAAALVLWGSGAGAAEHEAPKETLPEDQHYVDSLLPDSEGWQAIEWWHCPGDARCQSPPINLDHALQICERHFHHAYPGYGPAYYDEPFENACLALQHRRDAADLDEVKRAAGEK